VIDGEARCSGQQEARNFLGKSEGFEHAPGPTTPLTRCRTAPRPSDLVCRKLRPGESGVYRALRLESLKRYPDSFGSTYAEEAQVSRLAFENAIDEGTSDRFVVAAFLRKQLVGIAGFARRERHKTRHRSEITQVYVDPDARGRSIGETLMRATLEMGFAQRGIEQVELSLVSTNHAARRLYERLGFEAFGLQANYFKTGDLSWHQLHMQVTQERFLAVDPA